MKALEAEGGGLHGQGAGDLLQLTRALTAVGDPEVVWSIGTDGVVTFTIGDDTDRVHRAPPTALARRSQRRSSRPGCARRLRARPATTPPSSTPRALRCSARCPTATSPRSSTAPGEGHPGREPWPTSRSGTSAETRYQNHRRPPLRGTPPEPPRGAARCGIGGSEEAWLASTGGREQARPAGLSHHRLLRWRTPQISDLVVPDRGWNGRDIRRAPRRGRARAHRARSAHTAWPVRRRPRRPADQEVARDPGDRRHCAVLAAAAALSGHGVDVPARDVPEARSVVELDALDDREPGRLSRDAASLGMIEAERVVAVGDEEARWPRRRGEQPLEGSAPRTTTT